MSELLFYQMDIIDDDAGHVRNFYSDLEAAKSLPAVFVANGVVPRKIEIRSFVFDKNLYKTEAALICGALNRETIKGAKKLLTWTPENGWIDNAKTGV
ncbi:hypothetical protein M2404_004065 [Rheinheimera pacifica]|uniref:hypothetical protein n=1 Tax=Rheinheimera pacifica TaxID=173990 RepID=UPI0021681CF0|nr:hypothetical protein [Rheinheimera pacifica]MCS4309688.1 hypothetical protein [Rheinheimera pacifica]